MFENHVEVLEPRVMQVLVRLARTPSQVVSRDALFTCCWEGRTVGEDSINRVIAQLRRLSEQAKGAGFRLETIRSVGYRLWPAEQDAISPEPRSVEVRAALRSAPPPLPDKPSIAVLPFQDLSPGSDQEYLVDAVTEDIVTALSRWRWFFVVDWRSSLSFKRSEAGLAQIGQELGVRYVLQGSLRKAGSRVRVTATLTDAASGVSLWADKFDRELTDIFLLQDEITNHVVGAIEPAMLNLEGARSGRKSLPDFSALDCFYRGMWHLNQVSSDGYEQALRLFREAIRRDPQLSLGYVGLARIRYGGAIYGWSPEPEAALAEARDAAQTAIALDPRDAQGFFAFSGAALYLREHDAALEYARRAVTLNPNFAFGHYRLGQVLTYSGRPAEAVEPIEQSLQFSPYDPQLGPMLASLALAHFHAGDLEEAERQSRAAIHFRNAGAYRLLAASLVRLDRLEEAAAAMRLAPREPEQARVALPAPYAHARHRDELHDSLRKAAELAAQAP